jgi:hypothetical protein
MASFTYAGSAFQEEPIVYGWECCACGGLQPHNVPQEDDEWECQACESLYTCDRCGQVTDQEQYENNAGHCRRCEDDTTDY